QSLASSRVLALNSSRSDFFLTLKGTKTSLEKATCATSFWCVGWNFCSALFANSYCANHGSFSWHSFWKTGSDWKGSPPCVCANKRAEMISEGSRELGGSFVSVGRLGRVWSEGRDDFFETGVASQRIPEWMQA